MSNEKFKTQCIQGGFVFSLYVLLSLLYQRHFFCVCDVRDVGMSTPPARVFVHLSVCVVVKSIVVLLCHAWLLLVFMVACG